MSASTAEQERYARSDVINLLMAVPHYQTSYGGAHGYNNRALLEKAHFYNKGYGLYKFDANEMKKTRIVNASFGGAAFLGPRSASIRQIIQKNHRLLGIPWDDNNTAFPANTTVPSTNFKKYAASSQDIIPPARCSTKLNQKVSKQNYFEGASKEKYVSEYVGEFCSPDHPEDTTKSREIEDVMPLSTQVGDAAVSLPMPYFKDEPLLTVVGHMKMNDKENGQVANRPTITIDEMKKPGVVKHIFAEPEIPADLSLKKFILNHNHTAAVKDKYSTLHTFVDTDTLDKYIAASAQGGK